jgi:hypothetical protein
MTYRDPPTSDTVLVKQIEDSLRHDIPAARYRHHAVVAHRLRRRAIATAACLVARAVMRLCRRVLRRGAATDLPAWSAR